MSAMRLSLITAALVAVLTPTTACWAQAYGLEGVVENNDLRWFEPVELDLDGQIAPQAGFFFRYEKLVQHFGGEKVEIGDPLVLNDSELVYGQISPQLFQARVNEIFSTNPDVDVPTVEEFLGITFQRDPNTNALITQDFIVINEDDTTTTIQVPVVGTVEDAPPPAYNVTNSILDATPDAAIGWGERYEFGYSDGERGWIVGVLDGPEANSGGVFGAGEGGLFRSQTNGLPGPDPFFVDDLTDADGDGILDNPSDNIDEFFAFGFGSVSVNFSAPEGFFVGFRDYQINNSPTSGTTRGPIYYAGNYGSIDDDLDLTTLTSTTFADDLDGDGSSFFLVLADLDGDGTIDDDEIIGTITDFGDLYSFDVFFDEVTVRNRVEMDGIELMLTHEIKTSHRLEQGRRDHLQFRYGVNFLRIRDEFTFQGLGSILGRTTANHDVDNQIVGPQVGLRWTRDRGKWDFTLDGRVTFGYNIADLSQNDIFGEELIPGALNRPILGRTTTTVNTRRFDSFSPMGELRAEFRYKITKALAIKAGYTARFIDNVQRASETVVYSAPYFGTKSGERDIFINGLSLGVEFRH